MSNLLVNQRDQEFLLFEQLGIEKLFKTETFKDFSKDDALMMIKEAEKLALNEILPTYAVGRQGGVHAEGWKGADSEMLPPGLQEILRGWVDNPDRAG